MAVCAFYLDADDELFFFRFFVRLREEVVTVAVEIAPSFCNPAPPHIREE
jgi:hypothetical protein